jgi:hypothetical protein
MSKIRVVVVALNKPAEVVEIENTLEAKQAIVGGNITCPSLDDSLPENHPLLNNVKNIDIVAADDTVEPLNWLFSEDAGIFGTFLLARANPRTGNYVSLTEEDIQNLLSIFLRK